MAAPAQGAEGAKCVNKFRDKVGWRGNDPA